MSMISAENNGKNNISSMEAIAVKTEHTVLHLCGGIGGGTIGFNGARSEFMGKVGRFRTLCSIDVDPIACKNYEALTGSRAVQMDLFSRQQ